MRTAVALLVVVCAQRASGEEACAADFPSVDISPFLVPDDSPLASARDATAAAWDHAMREWGFAMAEMVAQSRAATQELAIERPRTVRRPHAVDERPFEIVREGRSDGMLYRIVGEKPERFVQQTDFDNDEAVGYLSDRLNALRIDEALYEAGATPGDAVAIGPHSAMVFDWEPTISAAGYTATAPRGTDERLLGARRRTTAERREEYYERMDEKSAAREELAREREAGMWSDDSTQE